MTSIKRSSAIPLSLVPALAAGVSCGPSVQTISGVDPCLPQVYNEVACQYSISHQGYYYNGLWYHHVYSMPFIYYHNGYSGYVGSGGVVRSLGSGAYAPHIGSSTSGRSTVVRGGFGSIGGSRGFSGS